MNIQHQLSIFLLILLFSSCSQNQGTKTIEVAKGNEYAQGFEIITTPEGYKLKVISPWMDGFDNAIEYELLRKESKIKKNTITKQYVNIPLKRIAIMSTTHLAMIEALDELKTVTGISERQYVNSKEFWKKNNENSIIEIGYENTLDFEAVVKLMPDAIFIYGLSSTILQTANRLIEVGIPVIFVSEFNEMHPLAKMEWLKYIGCFYNKYNMADSIVNHKINLYKLAKEPIKNIQDKPTVLAGLPWKDIWNIPGANTTTATFIKDAGASYIFQNLNEKINYQLGIEEVYLQAGNAEYWINVGFSNTKQQIIDSDSRFSNFEAFKKGTIYNNNKLQNSVGGNDYLESGIMNPEIILADLISIFHPQLMETYTTQYYKRIE